jgi:hypothetical protein
MHSLKEKQASLAERWKIIHKAQPSLVVRSIPQISDTKDEWDLLRKTLGMIGDLKKKLPPGVKNSNPQLANITGAIEWYGNVAVGIDKNFEGWVTVVTPGNGSINYFGLKALERARQMANNIKGQYK